jgi:DHA2 family multidrug resistance protein-like MFS transporter
VVGSRPDQGHPLWPGIGGAITALGPMLAGLVLQHFWWGSAFLLTHALGSGFTLLSGYLFCLHSFVTMLVAWKQGSSYWVVGLAFAFLGAGAGLAGTPASHSLTSSVPTRRAGMASGAADLQRDLGGAIMQSILGALLTAGYARVIAKSVASSPSRSKITGSVQSQLEKSFAGAQQAAAG